MTTVSDTNTEYSNEKLESMKRKIKGLLDKASDDIILEAERDALLNKANDLMMKYMIEESSLRGMDPNDFIRIEIDLGPNSNRTRLLVNLLGTIAKPHGVQHAYTELPMGGRKKKVLGVLWGRASTVKGVEALFSRLGIDLLAQVSDLKIVPWNKEIDYNRDLSPAANTRQIRDSFIAGYTEAVGQRLRELNAHRDDESDGRFLPVLVSDYEQAQKMAGFLQSGKQSRANNSGRMAGHLAGSRASLANRSMPNAPKQLGG